MQIYKEQSFLCRVVIVTIDGLYETQRPFGILSYVDLQCVVGAGAVVVEELQTLKSSFGVKDPALKQSRITSVGCAGVEVHEVARA